MAVRRVRADEWGRWRDFRLAMLAEAPYAFGTTLAEVLERPDGFWRDRVADLATATGTCYYVAERDGEWLAGAGGYVEDGVPNVFGVWTHPDARGQGHAGACTRAVVDWARATGAREVRLWATDTNIAARRVYDRLGFTPAGSTQPLPSDPALTESEYTLLLR